MKLSGHDLALIKDLKQPIALLSLYLLLGVLGLALAWGLDLNPVLRTLLTFLCGFLIGFAGEKLVTKRS